MSTLLKARLTPRKDTLALHNLKKRIEEHNRGKSQYTNQFIPWRLVVAMKFTNDRKTQEFERYLKSGSGHAFAKRHFW